MKHSTRAAAQLGELIQNKKGEGMVDEIYLQKVIKLLREQLEWEIKPNEGFYQHLVKVMNENNLEGVNPEEFVLRYRLTFKPKFPDHPTGGVFF